MKVIFVSGWANAAEAMDPLASMLADHWAIDCVDLHSLEELGSKFPLAGISTYAAGLLAWMHRVGEPCVVGGWSMGGLVVQEAVAVSPAVFAGLLFFGATPKFCMGDGFVYGTPITAIDEMKSMLKKAKEPVLRAFYCECAGLAKGQGKGCDVFMDAAMALGDEVLARGLDYLKSSDFREAIAKINCPSLVFHGSRDLVISPKAGRELARLCRADFITIKGGHHDLVLSATEQIGLKVHCFLQENF